MERPTVGDAPAIATTSSGVVLPFFKAAVVMSIVVVAVVVTFNSRQEIIIRINCDWRKWHILSILLHATHAGM